MSGPIGSRSDTYSRRDAPPLRSFVRLSADGFAIRIRLASSQKPQGQELPARVDGQVHNCVYSSLTSSLNRMRFTVNKIVHHHDVVFVRVVRARRDITARDPHSRDACVRKNNSEERQPTTTRRRRDKTAEQQLARSAVVLDQRSGVP